MNRWTGAAVLALLLLSVIAGWILIKRGERPPAGAPESNPPATPSPEAASARSDPPPAAIRAVPDAPPGRQAAPSPVPATPSARRPKAPAAPDPAFVADVQLKCRITGRVLSANGTPVAGARLSAENSLAQRRKETGAAGRFEFTDLFPVRTTVHALSAEPGRLRVGRSAEVLLERAETHEGLDVRFQAGPDLSVDVRYEDGTPVAGMRLVLGFERSLMITGFENSAIVTDADGRWIQCGTPDGGLPPDATVALALRPEDEAGIEVRPAIRQAAKSGAHLAFSIGFPGGAPRSDVAIRFEYSGPPLKSGKMEAPDVQVNVLRGEDVLASRAGKLAPGINEIAARLPAADPLDGLELEVVSVLGWLRAPLTRDAAGVLHARGTAWDAGAEVWAKPMDVRKGLRAWENTQPSQDRTLAVLRRPVADAAGSGARRIAEVWRTGGFKFRHVPPGTWRLSLVRNGRPLRFRLGGPAVSSIEIEVGGDDLELSPLEEIE